MKTLKVFFSILAIALISLQVNAQSDLKVNSIYWQISKEVQKVSNVLWLQNQTGLRVKSIDTPEGVISKRVNLFIKSTSTPIVDSNGNIISNDDVNWFHSKGVTRTGNNL